MNKYLPIAVMLTLVASGFVEFLGHRISEPEFGGGDLLRSSFLLSTLNTAAGAAFSGLIFVACGFAINSFRDHTRISLLRSWCLGSFLFLLIILMLVLWAP